MKRGFLLTAACAWALTPSGLTHPEARADTVTLLLAAGGGGGASGSQNGGAGQLITSGIYSDGGAGQRSGGGAGGTAGNGGQGGTTVGIASFGGNGGGGGGWLSSGGNGSGTNSGSGGQGYSTFTGGPSGGLGGDGGVGGGGGGGGYGGGGGGGYAGGGGGGRFSILGGGGGGGGSYYDPGFTGFTQDNNHVGNGYVNITGSPNFTAPGLYTYTIPTTGAYHLTVAGAQGGNSTSFTTFLGGDGVVLNGTINLAAGTVLDIVVGGQGHSGDPTGAGGGGGSFVYFTSAAVPEPGSVVLMGLGLLGAGGVAWRNRRRTMLES